MVVVIQAAKFIASGDTFPQFLKAGRSLPAPSFLRGISLIPVNGIVSRDLSLFRILVVKKYIPCNDMAILSVFQVSLNDSLLIPAEI